MKKLLISLLCSWALCISAQTYIDLDLPSGTLWKSQNEKGDFYSYNQAEKLFGDKMPAKWQWDELRNSCVWEWTGSGYLIKGKNGKSIFLPAAGCRTNTGYVKGMGERGFYWTYTPKGLDEAIGFTILANKTLFVEEERSLGGRTVRLIK